MEDCRGIPSLHEIRDILFDEEKAEHFLFEKGILYPKPLCYACAGPTKRKDNCWRCIKKSCAKAVSITKGSFFEKSKLKFSEVLLIAYLWLTKVPPSSIQIITGHSNKTICDYINYLNELVEQAVDEEKCFIGGLGIQVELDECKISRRKYNRGHHIEGAWLFGGVERTQERRIFVEVIPDRSAGTLQSIIQRNVREGSDILTDCWKAYAGLSNLNYTHSTVNHSKYFKDPITQVHTNGIEARWSGIKRTIAVRNRSADTINGHLMSYIWRHQNRGKLWDAFIKAMADIHYY